MRRMPECRSWREQAVEKHRAANKHRVQLGKWVNLVQVVCGDNRQCEGLYQELIEVSDDEVEEMDVEELLENIDDDL